jgi:hypothetical protein
VQKNFLSRIFGFIGISQHAHAQGINAPAVQPVKPLERSCVASLRHLYDLSFRQLTKLRCLLNAHEFLL